MNKYEQYKPSGVEWLGEVPRHWEVEKAKFNFDFSKGLTITKENLVDDGIPCVNYGEIHSKYAFEVNPEIHNLKCVPSEYLEHSQFALLKNGDFIFADTSEDVKGSGNFTHLSSDMPTFAGYHTIIARLAKKHHSKFLAYVFHSEAFRNQIRTQIKGVKVFSITQAILKNTFIWYPSYKEQTTITAYLDERTAYIDRLIAKQQALSEKLSEKRTALITEAVCGRVKISPNPSLQKRGTSPSENNAQSSKHHETAPLFSKEGLGEICFKDSGIQWLGKIPEHWEVKRLKFIAKIQTGNTPSRNDKDNFSNTDGVMWIKPEDLNQNLITQTKEYITEQGLKEAKYISEKAIFVCCIGSIGKMGYSNQPSTTNQQINSLIFNESIDFDFAKYMIIASEKEHLKNANGNVVAILNGETQKRIYFAIPPIEEQTTIVDFLDTETAKIDRLQAKIGESVERLKEYRAALITQVVTGKVKVNCA